MKKSVKAAAALLLAVSVLLTGCAEFPEEEDERPEKHDRTEKSDRVYQKADITQVEDEEFTVYDKTGLYTGDWKGNRPEGNGTLVISEDEYYSGTWENGYVSGQGEIKKVDSGGNVNYFKGECAYSVPSGKGQMTVGDVDGGTFTMLDGSFDGESPLAYFMIAENKLIDIGTYTDGNWTSYLDNYNVSGMSFSYGEYFGQVDESGVPNGYGYYRENNGNPKSYKEYSALGTWKDGELEGYYTKIAIDRGTTTKYVDKLFGREEIPSTWNTAIKEIGCLKNGQNVGVWTRSSSYDNNPRDNRDGVYVKTKNYDTGVTMEEEHWIDGTHIYNWKNAFNTEGEYWKYDNNWNLRVHNVTQNGQWTSLLNKDKEAQEIRNRMLEKCAYAAIIGLGIAIIYDVNRTLVDYDRNVVSKMRAEYAFSNKMWFLEHDAAEKLVDGEIYDAEELIRERDELDANREEWIENYKDSLNN